MTKRMTQIRKHNTSGTKLKITIIIKNKYNRLIVVSLYIFLEFRTISCNFYHIQISLVVVV